MQAEFVKNETFDAITATIRITTNAGSILFTAPMFYPDTSVPIIEEMMARLNGEAANETPPELTVKEAMKLPVDTAVMIRSSDETTWELRYFLTALPVSVRPFICFTKGKIQDEAEGVYNWQHMRLATQEEIDEHEQ